MMFGMMGQFLPATVATLIASNPVLLGAGAFFGGMQLMEDRKRRVTMRRQNARQQVRQFVDDVQFEVNDQLMALIRDVQRQLRDEFTERLTELQRTLAETAQRAQESAKQTQERQQTRAGELKQQLEMLGKIEQVAATVAGGQA
jgi:paraquat-inducible protein B